jgi:hypothetical protein
LAVTPAVSHTIADWLMRVTSKDILHPGISRSNGGRYLFLIAAALFLIALIDHATADFPFQHLYYLPIIFAAIRFGRRGGLFARFSRRSPVTRSRLAHFRLASAWPTISLTGRAVTRRREKQYSARRIELCIAPRNRAEIVFVRPGRT